MPEKTVLVQHYRDTIDTRSGPKVKHTFMTDDNRRLTTFKSDVADRASLLLNEPVLVEIRAEHRNGYSNLYLDSVSPVAAKVVAAPVDGTAEDERQVRIMRQSADKVAAQIVAAFIAAGKIDVAGSESISGVLTSLAEKRLAYYKSGPDGPARGTVAPATEAATAGDSSTSGAPAVPPPPGAGL